MNWINRFLPFALGCCFSWAWMTIASQPGAPSRSAYGQAAGPAEVQGKPRVLDPNASPLGADAAARTESQSDSVEERRRRSRPIDP